MYLHMTNDPFVVAENLATRVLVFESGPPSVTPDIFPPDVPYLKTCSRGVCACGEAARAPRRFALCSLLNHATPDVRDPEALAVFRAASRIDFTRYTQFRDHHNPAVVESTPGVYSAVYWNDREALVLLVNLADREHRLRWRIRPEHFGWGRDAAETTGTIPDALAPLAFQYVRVRRKARAGR